MIFLARCKPTKKLQERRARLGSRICLDQVSLQKATTLLEVTDTDATAWKGLTCKACAVDEKVASEAAAEAWQSSALCSFTRDSNCLEATAIKTDCQKDLDEALKSDANFDCLPTSSRCLTHQTGNAMVSLRHDVFEQMLTAQNMLTYMFWLPLHIGTAGILCCDQVA